jgi:hypothetical protein
LRNEFAKPATRQRLAQPDAHFLPHALRHGSRPKGCVRFNLRHSIHRYPLNRTPNLRPPNRPAAAVFTWS